MLHVKKEFFAIMQERFINHATIIIIIMIIHLFKGAAKVFFTHTYTYTDNRKEKEAKIHCGFEGEKCIN